MKSFWRDWNWIRLCKPW